MQARKVPEEDAVNARIQPPLSVGLYKWREAIPMTWSQVLVEHPGDDAQVEAIRVRLVSV